MAVEILSPDEKEVLLKILLLKDIEEYLAKKFPETSLDEKKKKIMDLLPFIDTQHPDPDLELSCGLPEDMHKSFVLLELYSRIYLDLIKPDDKNIIDSALKKIKDHSCLPEFQIDLQDILSDLDRILGVEEELEAEEEKMLKIPMKEELEVLPETKDGLEEYFHNEIIRNEFLLEIDPKIRPTLNKMIKEYLDRFIEVSEETAWKSIEYEHIPNTKKAYNEYVEEKVKASIKWLIEKDIIIEEILKRLTNLKK